jgi:hypothetical protein
MYSETMITVLSTLLDTYEVMNSSCSIDSSTVRIGGHSVIFITIIVVVTRRDTP